MTCGNCKFAVKVSNPSAIGVESLACFLLPPQCLAVQNGPQMAVVSVRPTVSVNDPACANHWPKATEKIV